jgi:two-component system cell cycle response regulator
MIAGDIESLDLEQGGSGCRFQILVAEDNPIFQSMLKAMLTRWGYEVVIAKDGKEAWDILESPNAPRLALLDWMMPLMDGVEICRRVRAAGREPYVYIVLLTARAESQDLVEGMEAGADDYLTKPFHAHELRVRLRAGRRILELQEQLLEAREALREQATHDGLTGLLNRATVLDALSTELERGRRQRQHVAVLLVDVDRFKAINDTYGHHAGDIVLCEVARRMKAAMRRYDSAGRYGGEEFLMVMPGCDPLSARMQAERIRRAIGTEPYLIDSRSLIVTCSIGLSCRPATGAQNADTFVREADSALYAAKAGGRNCVVVAQEEPLLAESV